MIGIPDRRFLRPAQGISRLLLPPASCGEPFVPSGYNPKFRYEEITVEINVAVITVISITMTCDPRYRKSNSFLRF
jgi:hypothetical protein